MHNPRNSEQNKNRLPFLWGAATSSHQVEGGNRTNDWWRWEEQGGTEGGVRSGACTDHWNRFREDLKLAADLGMNTYRFSIEWSRIEPEQGKWDMSAVEWYRELIAECHRLKMVPMLTLHHFTSPVWFADQGGFTWEGAAERFGIFTRFVAQQLGSQVDLWCTINEPMVLVVGTYLGKFMPPALQNPALASKACHGLLKCHVTAYDILHEEIKRPIQVGYAHNMLDVMPERSWHPFERILAMAIHWFYNRAWLDATAGRKQWFGIPGLVPRAKVVPEAYGRITADYIGVNYYTKAVVQWMPRGSKIPVGMAFAQKGDSEISDVDWAVHPQGFYNSIKLAASYGRPIYITENGIADAKDRLRPSYIAKHVKVMAKAIADGIDLRGFYYWSLLDNFEWIKGFGPRFGLFEVNYQTFERKARPSTLFFKFVIEQARKLSKNHEPSVEAVNQAEAIFAQSQAAHSASSVQKIKATAV